MWLTLGRKTVLLIFLPFYLFEQKQLINKSKFSSGFAPFQTFWEKQISEYFSAPFWDSDIFDWKDKFSVNFPQNLQNNRKT